MVGDGGDPDSTDNVGGDRLCPLPSRERLRLLVDDFGEIWSFTKGETGRGNPPPRPRLGKPLPLVDALDQPSCEGVWAIPVLVCAQL